MPLERLFNTVRQQLTDQFLQHTSSANQLVTEGNTDQARACIISALTQLDKLDRVNQIKAQTFAQALSSLRTEGIELFLDAYSSQSLQSSETALLEPPPPVLSSPGEQRAPTLPQQQAALLRQRILEELDLWPLTQFGPSVTRLTILQNFYQNPSQPLFITQISKNTGLNPGSVTTILNQLKKLNIIEKSHTQGLRQYYRLKPDSPYHSKLQQLFQPQTTIKQPQAPIEPEADLSSSLIIGSLVPETATSPISIKLPEALLSTLDEPAALLLEKFLSSPTLHQLIRNLAVAKLPDSNLPPKELEGKLAGLVFEELGYLHFKQSLEREENVFVLSPEQTLDLYAKLHPDKQIHSADKYGFFHTIQGVRLPDSVVVRDAGSFLIIDGIIECKASTYDLRKQARVLRQFQGYTNTAITKLFKRARNGGVLHDIRQDIPPKRLQVNQKLSVYLGVPNNSVLIGQNLENLLIEPIPVSSYQLHQLVEYLIDISYGYQSLKTNS